MLPMNTPGIRYFIGIKLRRPDMLKRILPYSVLLFALSFSCSDRETGPNGEYIPPEPRGLNIGMNSLTMTYGGISREFTVHLPESYIQGDAYPVVFGFHGLGGTWTYGRHAMGEIVESENIIGIYPQGYQNSWNAGSGAVPSTEDDVGFTLQMLNWLAERVNIDTARVYSMGYSNGGAISYRLARDTNRFAAVASIAASHFQGLTIPEGTAPVSVMQIHGEDDIVVPYEGGQSWNLDIVFQSAYNTVLSWAIHNGLQTDPEVTNTENDMIIYRFTGPGSPHEAVLYCLEGTNHNFTTHPFGAGRECYNAIWEFFVNHPKN